MADAAFRELGVLKWLALDTTTGHVPVRFALPGSVFALTLNVLLRPGLMSSLLVVALRKRHFVDDAVAVQPAGGVGQLVIVHVDGRLISTAPMDVVVPVFFTVNV